MLDPRTAGIGKFGQNLDLDAANAEDVWSQGGTYTYQSSAVALFVSSSNAGDTSGTVRVYGLDADGLETYADVTPNGQAQVAIAGTWLRVYRAFNAGAAAFSGDIYIAETDSLTGGVPDTATKIKAKIDQAVGQALMALTTVPVTVGTRTVRKAYITDLLVGILAGTAAATTVNFDLFVRASGGVFLSKSSFGLYSSAQSTLYRPFGKYIEVDPLSDIKITADSDKDNALVTGEFTVLYELA